MDDGRRLRRDRNRDAVVDAALDLINGGNLSPSSDEIAQRAGLSARSLFRYFADIDDLTRAAIHRQVDRLRTVVQIEIDTDAPLSDRIDALVAQRLQVIGVMGLVGHVSRIRALNQPLVRGELAAGRAFLRRQIEAVFAPELMAMPEADAHDAVAALDVLTSYEGYHLMADDQGQSVDDIARVWRAGISRLVAAHAGNAAERV